MDINTYIRIAFGFFIGWHTGPLVMLAWDKIKDFRDRPRRTSLPEALASFDCSWEDYMGVYPVARGVRPSNQEERLGLPLDVYDGAIRELEIRKIISAADMKAIPCEFQLFSGQERQGRIFVGNEMVTCRVYSPIRRTHETFRDFEWTQIENFTQPIPADVLMVANKWHEIFGGEEQFDVYSPINPINEVDDPLLMMSFNKRNLSYIIAWWEEIYDL